MRLEKTKRYAAALLCAGGLSLLGNTVWADGQHTWRCNGKEEQIDDQEAQTRCTQCQQNIGGIGNTSFCTNNVQVCNDVNIVIAPTITVGH
jgi:hypothetical protein